MKPENWEAIEARTMGTAREETVGGTWQRPLCRSGHTQADDDDDDDDGEENASYIQLCVYRVGTANGERGRILCTLQPEPSREHI